MFIYSVDLVDENLYTLLPLARNAVRHIHTYIHAQYLFIQCVSKKHPRHF